MTKIQDFLLNREILEQIDSPLNGKLTVVKELGWGTYIMGDGLAQSGGIAQEVWNITFKTLAQRGFKKVLIVGFGGGGIAKLVSTYWNNANITGVEIDPIIVELGKKYLGINKINFDISIADGVSFCQQLVKEKRKFDLVCVDTYVGQDFPENFESKQYLECVRQVLNENGLAIFNRLYFEEKIDEAHKFQSKIEKIFPLVEVVKPEANIMFVCYNHYR